ncbi:right-handed parallel beta-helix repeat-containing protein [Candidatus Bipolaricaulota bacterium]|nr:right-handed parallel beta-helix repeat-containing protein [Candidatus Bipolaricaulota bacterium]
MKYLIFKKSNMAVIALFSLVFLFTLTTVGATIKVSKVGGQFSSIQAAIDAADPEDTILIKEGAYEENLTVNKDLTIEGDGKEKVKIIGKRNGHPALLIGPKSVKVTVRGLTLKDARGAQCEDKEKGVCPRGISAIGKAHIIVKESTITGNSAGVLLHDNTRAEITDCDVSSNFYHGIELVDSATAFLANVEASGHKFEGVGLKDSSGATIRDSTFTKNQWGIAIRSSSRSRVENNKILKNDLTGIRVFESAKTTITDNEIEDNGEFGISFSNSIHATVTNNLIQDNRTGVAVLKAVEFEGSLEGFGNLIIGNTNPFSGVPKATRIGLQAATPKASLPGKAVVNGNEYSSIQAAIDAASSGDTVKIKQGTYRENLYVDKDLTLIGPGPYKAWLVSPKDGYPAIHVGPSELEITLRGLTFTGMISKGCAESKKGICPSGISAVGDAKLTVRNCRLTDNSSSGISLRDSSQALVTDSHLSWNGGGILLRNSAKASLEDNQIFANKRPGVLIADGATAEVANNTISQNKYGVSVWNSAKITLEDNEIKHNIAHGVRLYGSIQATITNNEISSNVTSGISIEGKVEATIKNNTIVGNDIGIGPWSLDDGYEARLQGFGNQLKNNREDFKFIPGSVRRELETKARKVNATVGDDKFRFIQAAILAAEPGDTVQIKPGTYEESLEINKDLTLKGAGESKVTIKSGKKLHSVVLVGPSDIDVTVKGMTLQDTAVSKCKSARVCSNGVYLDGKANLKLENVTIRDSGKEGISVRDNAKVTLLNSTIKDNRRRGMWLAGSASAVIKDSSIINNTNYGIEFANPSFHGTDEIDSSSQLTIVNSLIKNNKWGGLQLEDLKLINIQYSDIKNNGDGIIFSEVKKAKISGNEIEKNGTGILLHRFNKTTLTNNSILKNKVGMAFKKSQKFNCNITGHGNRVIGNKTDFKGFPELLIRGLTETNGEEEK